MLENYLILRYGFIKSHSLSMYTAHLFHKCNWCHVIDTVTLLCCCLLLNLCVICLCLCLSNPIWGVMCLVEHTHNDGTPFLELRL